MMWRNNKMKYLRQVDNETQRQESGIGRETRESTEADDATVFVAALAS